MLALFYRMVDGPPLPSIIAILLRMAIIKRDAAALALTTLDHGILLVPGPKAPAHDWHSNSSGTGYIAPSSTSFDVVIHLDAGICDANPLLRYPSSIDDGSRIVTSTLLDRATTTSPLKEWLDNLRDSLSLAFPIPRRQRVPLRIAAGHHFLATVWVLFVVSLASQSVMACLHDLYPSRPRHHVPPTTLDRSRTNRPHPWYQIFIMQVAHDSGCPCPSLRDRATSADHQPLLYFSGLGAMSKHSAGRNLSDNLCV
ncbi:hypothetical protein ONZ45_g15582 [Pleurotus djamor]|nr:hypothetical protein ONZ45_g15582 [Pleurotus djamor]